MLQEFKCLKCEHYKNIHGLHWCVKCNDEVNFETKNLLGQGYLWLPKACYFNKYFEPKDIKIPDNGLCCQVDD